MLEPPTLTDESIVTAVEAHYALPIVGLTFIPIGNDAATWVYRVHTRGGQDYFLKIRGREGFSVASLLAPHTLQEQGVPHILAPLATTGQNVWVAVGDFMLTLYPFIEGRMGAHVGLAEAQWRAFGTLVRQMHDCRPAQALLDILPCDDFVPSRRHLLEELQEIGARRQVGDPVQHDFLAFWRQQSEVIATLVEQVDGLGAQLRQTAAPRVLCHGDMHTWNVLLDGQGDWWLVDWDEVVLALKECDLMFVVGGLGGDGVGPQQTERFLEGYGDRAVDPVALTYYRTAWAVQDIAAYGEQVFFAPGLGEVSRRAALDGFVSTFAPGNIVSRALRT